MGWQEYEIRTEELTTRTYKVNAQSYKHALSLIEQKIEQESDHVDSHECVNIYEHGEEVRP